MNIVRFVALGALTLGMSVASMAQTTMNTVVSVTGQMLNANTLQPVEASYGVFDANGKKIGQTLRSNAVDGYFITGLKPGEDYLIRIEDPRYFKQEYRLQMPKTTKYAELSKDFTVKPLEAGRSIPVMPVPFDVKKTTLKVGSDEILDDVAKLLIMNPSVKVELRCYADEAGADGVQRLSTERGNAIKAYFVKAGVSENRLTVTPVSTTDPINPPPLRKGAKGKRYVGPVYVVVTSV